MAGEIRESKTVLTAEDKTAGAFASMQRSIEATTSRLSGLAALAGGGMVGGFALMIKNANDAMAAMKDLGQEAGVTASALSRFEEPAKLAGMTLADISSAIQKMSKSMIEAKDPTSKAAQALGAFGLSMRDMAGLKPDEMFEKIAKASTLYGNSIEKNAALQELFGKSGSALQKVFAEIADKGQLMATVTDEQADAADKLNDSIDKLGLRSDQWRRQIASELTPTLQKIIDLFTEMTGKKEEAGGFFEFVGGVARLLTFTVAGLVLTLRDLADQAEHMAKQAQNITAIKGPAGLPIGFRVDNQEQYDTADRARMARFQTYEASMRRLHESMKTGKAYGDGDLDNFSPERMGTMQGKLKAGFDTTTKAVKDNKDAIKEAEKALRDYVNAAMAALAQDEETAKQLAALEDKRTAAILSTEKVIAKIEFETSLIGLNNDEREKAIALRALETSGIDKESTAFDQLKTRLVAALDQQKAVRDEFENMRQQGAMWDELAGRAGNFFSDLVMNGKSAFDRLRESIKSLIGDMLALFAKKWILNMAGDTAGASAAGAGTTAGSMLSRFGPGASGIMGTAGLFATVAAAGYGLGSFGAGALGAGEKGQKAGGIAGALGGGLIGAIIGKFTDPNGLANRTADFGGGRSNYWHGGGSSAFGNFGITNDKWFSDADMLAKVQTFQTGLAAAENALAKYLTVDQIKKVTDALASSKNYSFGTEHGDFAGTLGQILKDRIDAIIQAVDPSLKKWLDSFTGTGDELAAYAETLLQVNKALGSDQVKGLLAQIPELTIDGLMAMKQAGESLADTFQRVVGDFLTAQNALNAAIGSRNPAFARDMVLGQRNAIGGQFASLIGQQYGADLASRMALDPQSFTGLGTEGMQLLAQWLGLQTTLEQLDAQLSGGTSQAVSDFTNTLVNSASAMGGAISGLAAYLRGSLLSDLSPLNPQARYNEARNQYNANLTLAQGGNIDAIANFGSLRDQFLTASRAVNASSGQYNTDFFSSYNAGAALTGGQVRPYTAADGNANTAAIVAAVAATASGQQVTNTILVDYLNELANGNTAQSSARIVELLGMLNDRVRQNGGALTSNSGALA